MCSHKEITWITVPNTVTDRMINNSLTHTFISSRKIRKTTKLFNAEVKKRGIIKDYKEYVAVKTSVLRQVPVDNDTTDTDIFSDDDYRIIHNSESKLKEYRIKNSKAFTSDEDKEASQAMRKMKENNKTKPVKKKTKNSIGIMQHRDSISQVCFTEDDYKKKSQMTKVKKNSKTKPVKRVTKISVNTGQQNITSQSLFTDDEEMDEKKMNENQMIQRTKKDSKTKLVKRAKKSVNIGWQEVVSKKNRNATSLSNNGQSTDTPNISKQNMSSSDESNRLEAGLPRLRSQEEENDEDNENMIQTIKKRKKNDTKSGWSTKKSVNIGWQEVVKKKRNTTSLSNNRQPTDTLNVSKQNISASNESDHLKARSPKLESQEEENNGVDDENESQMIQMRKKSSEIEPVKNTNNSVATSQREIVKSNRNTTNLSNDEEFADTLNISKQNVSPSDKCDNSEVGFPKPESQDDMVSCITKSTSEDMLMNHSDPIVAGSDSHSDSQDNVMSCKMEENVGEDTMRNHEDPKVVANETNFESSRQDDAVACKTDSSQEETMTEREFNGSADESNYSLNLHLNDETIKSKSDTTNIHSSTIDDPASFVSEGQPNVSKDDGCEKLVKMKEENSMTADNHDDACASPKSSRSVDDVKRNLAAILDTVDYTNKASSPDASHDQQKDSGIDEDSQDKFVKLRTPEKADRVAEEMQDDRTEDTSPKVEDDIAKEQNTTDVTSRDKSEQSAKDLEDDKSSDTPGESDVVREDAEDGPLDDEESRTSEEDDTDTSHGEDVCEQREKALEEVLEPETRADSPQLDQPSDEKVEKVNAGEEIAEGASTVRTKQAQPKITSTEILSQRYRIVSETGSDVNVACKSAECSPAKLHASTSCPSVVNDEIDMSAETINVTSIMQETDHEEDEEDMSAARCLSPQTEKRLQRQARLNLIVDDDSSDSEDYPIVGRVPSGRKNRSIVDNDNENDDHSVVDRSSKSHGDDTDESPCVEENTEDETNVRKDVVSEEVGNVASRSDAAREDAEDGPLDDKESRASKESDTDTSRGKDVCEQRQKGPKDDKSNNTSEESGIDISHDKDNRKDVCGKRRLESDERNVSEGRCDGPASSSDGRNVVDEPEQRQDRASCSKLKTQNVRYRPCNVSYTPNCNLGRQLGSEFGKIKESARAGRRGRRCEIKFLSGRMKIFLQCNAPVTYCILSFFRLKIKFRTSILDWLSLAYILF